MQKALSYNPEDKDIKQALKALKSKQAADEVTKLKEKASAELANNKVK